MIGSFQNFLEEILTNNFLGRPIQVGFEAFLDLHIGDGGGVALKG